MLLALSWTGPLAAQDRVLLVPTPQGAPAAGLEHALRIQLSGIAEVSLHAVPVQGASVGERVRRAGALAAREGALLVAWVDPPLDRPDGTREVVIYAVGRREGRAVLEVVRVPGRAGPDVDRTLALKLREVVDALLEARDAGQDALLVPAAPPPAIAAVGQVGVQVVVIADTDLGQWGALGELGVQTELSGLQLRAGGGLALAPSVEVERAGQRVRFSELAPQLSASASVRAGALAIGLGTGVVLGVVQAEGLAAGGERGDRRFTLPSVRALLVAELDLTARVGVALALGVDARFQRQRLEVAGEPLADLGQLRPVGTLALVLR